jgi:hypothetical protein
LLSPRVISEHLLCPLGPIKPATSTPFRAVNHLFIKEKVGKEIFYGCLGLLSELIGHEKINGDNENFLWKFSSRIKFFLLILLTPLNFNFSCSRLISNLKSAFIINQKLPDRKIFALI